MKKITAASMLSVILITATLLICAPNKAPEKTVVDENVINKAALPASISVPTQSPTANFITDSTANFNGATTRTSVNTL